MTSITLDFPEEAFGSLRRSPEAFAAEIRLAAAIHWYQQGMVSQERALHMARQADVRLLERAADETAAAGAHP